MALAAARAGGQSNRFAKLQCKVHKGNRMEGPKSGGKRAASELGSVAATRPVICTGVLLVLRSAGSGGCTRRSYAPAIDQIAAPCVPENIYKYLNLR